MLPQAIRDFPSQFAFEPLIEHESKLKRKKKLLVCGMGGSQLEADILKSARPEMDLVGWRDYGLPPLADLSDRLIILSSYSGNTEEVLEALDAGLERGLAMAILAKGGKLIQEARRQKIPYVVVPDTNIQPRQSLGFMLRGLQAIIGDAEGLQNTRRLAVVLKAEGLEASGKAIAEKLKGRVPVVYASGRNEALARNWKIKFNENGKVPAFWNVFPELNHNEMTGFDTQTALRPVRGAQGRPEAFKGRQAQGKQATMALAKNFHFVFLEDPADHPQTRRRMRVLKKLYEERGLPVESVGIQKEVASPEAGEARSGEKAERYEAIFTNLLLADWATYYTALLYGTEPELVPMVEEFKRLI